MATSSAKCISLALDLRYASAFRWWDQAGYIADGLTAVNPNLNYNVTTNNALQFDDRVNGVSVSSGLNRFNVTQKINGEVTELKEPDVFLQQAPELAGVNIDGLHIQNVQRLGFQCVLRAGTNNFHDAVRMWEGSVLSQLTPSKLFDCDVVDRKVHLLVKDGSFENIQDIEFLLTAETYEIMITRGSGEALPVKLSQIHKQPSEMRLKSLIQSKNLKRALEENPTSGIVLTFDWQAEFIEKLNSTVIVRWLADLWPKIIQRRDYLLGKP